MAPYLYYSIISERKYNKSFDDMHPSAKTNNHVEKRKNRNIYP